MTIEQIYTRNFARRVKREGKLCGLRKILEDEIGMISKGTEEILFGYCGPINDPEYNCYYGLTKDEPIAYPQASPYMCFERLDDDHKKKITVIKNIKDVKISDNKLIIKGEFNYNVRWGFDSNASSIYVSVANTEGEPTRVFPLAEMVFVYRVTKEEE